MTKAELHRLKWLKVRNEVASVFLQSGYPVSLTGWRKEWKTEIEDLENKLAQTGQYMKSSIDNYRVVKIPDR